MIKATSELVPPGRVAPVSRYRHNAHAFDIVGECGEIANRRHLSQHVGPPLALPAKAVEPDDVGERKARIAEQRHRPEADFDVGQLHASRDRFAVGGAVFQVLPGKDGGPDAGEDFAAEDLIDQGPVVRRDGMNIDAILALIFHRRQCQAPSIDAAP